MSKNYLKGKLKTVYMSDPLLWVETKKICDKLTKDFGVPVSISRYIEIALREANEKRKAR